MNQYTILAIAFGVFVGLFSTASSLPIVFCQPNAMVDMPPKARQLCFALLEIEPPVQDEEPMETQVYGRGTKRGTKRQDVDHVFLRFGRPDVVL